MNEKELIEFLKEKLNIEISISDRYNTNRHLQIKLFLDKELIAEDQILVN